MAGNLTQGSQGRDVKELQRRLNLCQTILPSLAEDGIFGPKTSARLKAFQREKGLAADGIVGPNTEKVLLISTPVVSEAENISQFALWTVQRTRDIAKRVSRSDIG
jgi:peptidoglycan hydrolase-like protein with peptidoglycan-binding domain